MTYDMLSSNHSDYSTGVSSAGSTYDSDVSWNFVTFIYPEMYIRFNYIILMV